VLSPQGLSIIGVVYDGPDRVGAISIYGIVLGLAAVGGQLIGGVLVQADIAGLGWRTCFLINVPIRLVGLAVPAPAAPEPPAEGAPRPVPPAGRPPPRPRGPRHGPPRPSRHCPAACRGPPARLAGVDVGVPRRS